MSAPKRCLVVGLGQIGAGYDIDVQGSGSVYTHARAISLHPDFELAGGVDPDEKQRMRFETRHGVKAHETIADAMTALQPAVVVIATPAALHLRHVEEAFAAHLPEVLICEKPLALDQDEGLAIVSLCEGAGVALFVNYIRRSEPGAIEVRRRLDAGEIIAPVKATFWYSKGLFNNGSHFINLLQFWLGAVQGHLVLNENRRWQGVDPEPDVQLRLERGTVVLQAAWEEDFSFYGGELLSPSGRLGYGDGGSAIGWQGVVRNGDFGGHGALAPQVENIHNEMDRYQWHVYEQLARFLADKPWELCTGREALATLQIVSTIVGKYGDRF